MDLLTLKLFSAIRQGLIKSPKDFWEKFGTRESLEKLEINTSQDEKYLKENGLKIVSIFDNELNCFVGTIKKEEIPILLVCKGDVSLIENISKNVAVVGTLNPSEDIKNREQQIVQSLLKNEKVIVSGLANGCDTVAHETCLKCGGKTIAILPTTINNIYPKENITLADEIAKNGGLVLTEYVTEPATKFERINRFIARDRLQALFCKNIILIASHRQGEGDSGSRHAMSKAQKYGRNRYVMFNKSKDHGNSQFGLNEDLINMGCEILTKNNISFV